MKGSLLLVPALWLALGLISCGAPSEPEATLRPLADTVHLQTGDIAFREGPSLESRTVVSADALSENSDQTVYSHVGLVLSTPCGWQVLHAVPNERDAGQLADTIKLEPIESFFRSDRALHGLVVRYRSIAPADTLGIEQRAMSIWEHRPLFDNAFNMADTTAFYCTELVCFVYDQTLQVDLCQGRRHRFLLLPPMVLCSDLLLNKDLVPVWKW